MKISSFSLDEEKKRGVYEKDTLRKIKLLVPSQGATISPPLGPTLGQFGVNIKDFCDKFNEKSKVFELDIILGVFVTLFRNKNFDFLIKFPSVAFMINEEELNLENEFISKYLALSSIYKIVAVKKKNLPSLGNNSALNCVLGTARSMRVKIVNDVFS